MGDKGRGVFLFLMFLFSLIVCFSFVFAFDDDYIPYQDNSFLELEDLEGIIVEEEAGSVEYIVEFEEDPLVVKKLKIEKEIKKKEKELEKTRGVGEIILSVGKRAEIIKEFPPKTIYVASSRINCAKNGDFHKYDSSAMDYAWFVWEKGFKGKTETKWFN